MHARIQGLVDLFPRGNVLIDIGSDHGHLGLELLKAQKAKWVINIDLSQDALDRSELAYKRFFIDDRVTFIQNDGFTDLISWPKNSVVVIAGLGSTQILKILERIPEKIDHLILLSHTGYYEIRKWAYKNSFFIKREKYVEDGEYCYLILDLVKSRKIESGTFRDYVFGREEFWKKNRGGSYKLFCKYWRKHGERIIRIPQRFRDETENEIFRFLKEQKIL